jgi:arginine repressor
MNEDDIKKMNERLKNLRIVSELIELAFHTRNTIMMKTHIGSAKALLEKVEGDL